MSLPEIFSLEFMRLATVAGVSAAVSLSVLGIYVVLKRVVFVGLTLANLATLGAAFALSVGLPVEVSAMLAALAGAAALALAAKPRRIPAESVVGWGFAAAASLTVLVLARSAADSDAMRLLFGNVLAISRREAVLLVVVALFTVVVHAVFAKRLVLVVFDPETARAAGISTRLWELFLYLTVGAATAAAVHETGALLAFSLLTLPAMAALLVTRGMQSAFATAALIAVLAVVAGLLLSFRWDLPAGPFTVALLAAAVPLAFLLSRLRRHD